MGVCFDLYISSVLCVYMYVSPGAFNGKKSLQKLGSMAKANERLLWCPHESKEKIGANEPISATIKLNKTTDPGPPPPLTPDPHPYPGTLP